MEKMCDEYNQIAVVTNTKKQRLIIYNTYVAPGEDHLCRLDEVKIRIKQIFERYGDVKLIIFGDFNLNRTEFRNEFASHFRDKQLTYHIEDRMNTFPRC